MDEDDPPPGPCDCENPPPDGQECPPDSGSSGPVNYGTGQIIHREVDLVSDAFGIRWGHARSYANILIGTGGNGTSMNGNRWFIRQLKVLKFSDSGSPPSQVVVEDGANSSQYFTLDGSVYRNLYTGWNSLVWDEAAHEMTYTSAKDGQQWVFHDQTVSSALRGQLKRVVDAAGRSVVCTYDEDDLLVKFEQVVDGHTSGYYYTWTALASVESVTLKLQDKNVRRVRFTYYQNGDTGGGQDDLKSAIIEQYDVGTSSWRIVARKHYRYYLSGQANGFASGLKLVIGATAYQQMLDAGLNPETAPEADLKQFADFYYEYDSEKRVSSEQLEGGRRQYSFAYTINAAHDGGVNTWYTKTVETLPDGSQNRVYTNEGYSLLAKILQEAGTARQWVDAYQYDNQFRPTQHAHPSAVASVSEPAGSGAPLVINLHANTGLIEVTNYYAADNPTTGEVAGYVSTRGVKKGSAGALETTEKLKYDTQTVGSVSLHLIKEKLVYPTVGISDINAPKTTYARTWYADGGNPTFQVQELVITQPVVATDENGTGGAGVIRQVYDRFGRKTWEMNQRGVVSFRSYVQSTGAPLQRVKDANMDKLSDPPVGWFFYGQNLITDYVSDALGRITQKRGPWHEVQLRETDTTPTAIRRVKFAAFDDENHEKRTATGYMTGSDPVAMFTIVGAVQVTRLDANGLVVDEIQSVRCCPMGILTIDEPLPQSKWNRWTHRIYDPWGRLFAERIYFSIPASGEGDEGVNYMETTHGYDLMGRRSRVVDATHTIERSVFDVRNQSISKWVGTDDSGATDSDPTGGTTPGNNMVKVLELQYDGGSAGGNGNLTRETRPVDANAANDRITSYGYDFRDRRDTITETDGTTSWITKLTFDNLSHVVSAKRYHSTVADNNRIAQNWIYWDSLGRVFKSESDGIDPITGNVVGSLIGQNWYDLVGNVIKQSKAGNTAFTKTVFDALNRPSASYLCCRPGEAGVPAGNDNSLVGDTVVEETNMAYDAAGNVIMTTRKKRFDDATGTGVLKGPHLEPKSRDSYEMTWPDAIGRQRVTADYGTNGGSEPPRPDVAPTRSDTILVTTNRYKDSGDANAIIDPMGIETRWDNDHAGRRIRLIEGIAPVSGPVGTGCLQPMNGSGICNVPPSPPHSAPQVRVFGWHPSGLLSKLTLLNAETGDQDTRWFFGTTLSDSGVASNNLVRMKIYPESDDRPAPAGDGADGVYSRLEATYNRQGEQTTFKDADGTVHEYSYNKAGNRVEDRVPVLADGLNGDVRRIAYTYDNRGLAAKVSSHNAVSGGSIVNEVVLQYDAFMQLSSDTQSHSGAISASTPKTSYAYETGGAKNSIRRVSTTYPTNSRVLQIQYGAVNSMDDHLCRVSSLQVAGESAALVNYSYCGRAWQVRVAYPTPGLELRYRSLSGERPGDAGDPYTGYDRFGRNVDMPWVRSSDNSIVERSRYGFDRDNRRIWQTRPLTDTQDQQYDYDALSQVISAARGSLNTQGTAISGIPAQAESWNYDPTGNWRGYHVAANGNKLLDQSRVHDRGNRLTQIVEAYYPTVLDRAGRVRESSPDANGNWGGRLVIIWDAWSRITQVTSSSGTSGSYRYDGLHRRITRVLGTEVRHSYYNDHWRPIEERKNDETTPAISYLWGARHRDDLTRRDRATSGVALNESRYVLLDYFNPMAITTESGVVKERYAFSAFGVRTILNADFTARSNSECGMEFSFQGQFIDGESGLMNYGFRYYLPALGRWTCKDPIREYGGANLYLLIGNNSVNHVDHLGLAAGCNCPDGSPPKTDAKGKECCEEDMQQVNGQDECCGDARERTPEENEKCKKLKDAIEDIQDSMTIQNLDPQAWAAADALAGIGLQQAGQQLANAQSQLNSALTSLGNTGASVAAGIAGLAYSAAAYAIGGVGIGAATIVSDGGKSIVGTGVSAGTTGWASLRLGSAYDNAGRLANARNEAQNNYNAARQTKAITENKLIASTQHQNVKDKLEEQQEEECCK